MNAPAPGPPAVHRVGTRRIVAVVIAALMLVGIGALVAVAVWGGDGPSGAGLQRPVDVDQPAAADPPPEAGPGATADEPSADVVAAVPVPPAADATSGSGDDVDLDLDGSGTPGDVAPIGALDPLGTDATLPQPVEPVELPGIVAPPGPTTTVVAAAVGAFAPGAVPGLEDWQVSARETDYLQLTNGARVLELFVPGDGLTSADAALERFFDDLRDDLQEVEASPITRLPAPSTRYVSVAGAQFSAVAAGQQGTRAITGSVVAAVDGNDVAFVATATREGPASTEQLTADAALVNAVLAHVTA